MPVLAGWLTGEQVSPQIIEQTLTAMEQVLGQHGGQPARIVQPGMGLISFSDPAYSMQNNDEPPVLDWVPDRRTFVYRRPLSGAHVLYYIEDWPAKGNLLFASEIKALLTLGVARELRLAAVDALLHFGFIPAPWTMFKSIFVVPAGSILRWQHAKTVVNHATDFHFDTSSDTHPQRSQEDIIEYFKTLLVENTIALLPPHEQLIALTDGNPISFLPAFIASQQSKTPVTLASFGYKNDRSKAWRGIQRLAEVCQRPLLTVSGVDAPEFWLATLAALEAPCVDTRPLAQHQLLHAVATETGARVALTGLGASALFGQHIIAPIETPSIFSRETQHKIQEEERWEDSLHARKLHRRADQFSSERQKQYYLDLHLSMPDRVVSMTHQLAMQEGIVIRLPYLRSEVMNMLLRQENEMDREILLSSLITRHFPLLKSVQAQRQLEIPVQSLLHIHDSPLLQQTLSQEALQTTGIFNLESVVDLLKQKSVTRELILVFTTQLFCRLFGVEM